MSRNLIAMTLAAALASTGAVHAASIFSSPGGVIGGNQTWGGTLGLDFTVNTSVAVNSLGAFDAFGDGISDNIYTTIFDSLGASVTPTLNFAGSGPSGGAYISQSIAPVVLTPGNYQLASWGYSAADPNFNNNGPGGPITFNTLGGALTATGTEYNYPVNAGTLANIADKGTTRYGAGTFDATNLAPSPPPPPPPPPPPVVGPSGPGVYDAATGLAGNQTWTGTLGLNFTVNQAVRVAALGTFDSTGGTITSDIYGVIFDSNGAAVTPILNFNNTADPSGAAFVFRSFPTAVILAPGQYQVATWGYDSTFRNYNNSGPGGPVTFNTLGGSLTAVSSSYGASNTPGVYATIPDNGSTRYGASSFLAGAVPEPASWALMIGGIGFAGLVARRNRRTNTVYA